MPPTCGVTPASSLDEARLAAQETKARVQRAKTLLELYRRIDELSRPATEPKSADSKSEESKPAEPKPDEPPSPAKE